MELLELVKKNRSYRRFDESKAITMEELRTMAEAARLTASGGNTQKNRMKLICDPEDNKKLFPLIKWAALYTDWDGPEPGERPTAYVAFLAPKGVNCRWDEGIKAQTLLLAAVEMGYGGCMIASFDHTGFEKAFSVPEGYEPSLLVALGKPGEKVVLHDVKANDDLRYYRGEDQSQNVPKIQLDDLLV